MKEGPAQGSLASTLRRIRSADPLLLLLAGGFIFLLIERIRIGSGVPLWLDEGFTAAITSQARFSDLVRQIWLDPSGPLYYLMMWGLPGGSNWVLRFPSLLLMVGMAVLPLAWRMPNLSLAGRATWASLIFFWPFGMGVSAEARCYALLLFLATAQTIAFSRLLHEPGKTIAAIWVTLSSLTFLTHYFGGALGLVQLCVLILRLRERALPLWPALPLAFPALAWFIVHLPRLLQFAVPGNSWQWRLSPAQAFGTFLYPFGTLPGLTLAIVAGSLLIPKREMAFPSTYLPALCGYVAAFLLVITGMAAPVMNLRYLTACVPPMLLGIVLLTGNRCSWAALAAVFLITATGSERAFLVERNRFGLERPTQYLLADGPRRLVYSLGFGGQKIIDPSTGGLLGEFEFRRHGLATHAQLINASSASDLVRSAGRDAAIIWLYSSTQRTEAQLLMRSRTCRNERSLDGGALACRPLASRLNR